MPIEPVLAGFIVIFAVAVWLFRKHIDLLHERCDLLDDRHHDVSRVQDAHHALLMRICPQVVADVEGAARGATVYVDAATGKMSTSAVGPVVGTITEVASGTLAVVRVELSQSVPNPRPKVGGSGR